jgi:5-oxoprolinase (ATP-hydrolysing)
VLICTDLCVSLSEENEPLDVQGTRKAFQTLTDEVNASQNTTYSVEEIASGFLRVANEAMCRPIRNLTQVRNERSFLV